jgi:8-oxo-dGTP diphosphatase
MADHVEKFPRLLVTVDAVVILRDPKEREPKILLIKRAKDPYKDCWALPGGFFDLEDRDVQEACVRELKEETGLVISRERLEYNGVFSKKNRDPREAEATEPCRFVSNSFKIEISPEDLQEQSVAGGDDAGDAKFVHVSEMKKLAFDHKEIITRALKN